MSLVEYLKRLYDEFLALPKDDSEHEPTYKYERPSYAERARYIFVKVGAYLEEHVLGMTDGINRVWLRYNDPFVLDHELGHIQHRNWSEYKLRSMMSAGWRPDRSRFRLVFG